MSAPTYLSLFSGIGGLDLGLDRAGWSCAGQVEIDPYCRSVLERHWPEVPRHDDVRTAPAWWLGRGGAAVDLVAGGFPCQPFSIAGPQLGTADDRWGWPWMCDVVRAVRPRYVLVENVAALVRDSDAFGWILGDLHRLGFDARWNVVTACAAGAAHPRRRVFLVAHPRGEGLPRLDAPVQRVDLQPVAEAARRHWAAEPGVARVADGVPRRLVADPVRGLGNSVVPFVAEQFGRVILDDLLSRSVVAA
jgi:DNA (cytosine-5)-methyltransferase 1